MEYHVTMNGEECRYLDVWQILNSPEQNKERGGITITNLLIDWMKFSNKEGFFVAKEEGVLEMYTFIHDY